LEGFVDAVLIGSLDTVGIGGCIRLLLRGATRSVKGEGYGSTASTLEDNGKPSEDTFCKMFSRRWGPFLFPAAFETFDEWTGPRDAFAGCPYLWEAFLLLSNNACPVLGRRTLFVRGEVYECSNQRGKGVRMRCAIELTA
jgi:hypothetical protein